MLRGGTGWRLTALIARALPIQRGVPGYNESIGPLEEAIAKDPSFAPAYSGLAAAYAARSYQFERFDLSDEVAKLRAAAEKAIQLDPLSGEAYDAMGMAYARDAHWEQSEKSFRRAIELDPSGWEPHFYFAGYLLWPLGRIEEALKELCVAEKSDPLSPRTNFNMANVLIAAADTMRRSAIARSCLMTSCSRSSVWAGPVFGRGEPARR